MKLGTSTINQLMMENTEDLLVKDSSSRIKGKVPLHFVSVNSKMLQARNNLRSTSTYNADHKFHNKFMPCIPDNCHLRGRREWNWTQRDTKVDTTIMQAL